MSPSTANKHRELKRRRQARLSTPTDLSDRAVEEISIAMNTVLADVFALYVKTKSFHWHVSGPHFREYHKLFDKQSGELLEMIDPLAERVRKIGGATLRSVGEINRLQRVIDNEADFIDPADMLMELCEDNKNLAARLREAHDVCDEHKDLATASLIENWIDEAEERVWFLFETSRPELTGGH